MNASIDDYYGVKGDYSEDVTFGKRVGMEIFSTQDWLFFTGGVVYVEDYCSHRTNFSNYTDETRICDVQFFSDTFQYIQSSNKFSFVNGHKKHNQDNVINSTSFSDYNQPAGRLWNFHIKDSIKDTTIFSGGYTSRYHVPNDKTDPNYETTFNDVWVFDHEKMQWKMVVDNVKSEDMEDGMIQPRFGSCVASDTYEGYLFGGMTRNSVKFTTGVIHYINTTTHSVFFNSTTNSSINITNITTQEVIVNETVVEDQGGMVFADIWKFKLSDYSFTKLKGQLNSHGEEYIHVFGKPSKLNFPRQRDGAYCWYSDSKYYLYGGIGNGGVMNDFWHFNLTLNQWVPTKKHDYHYMNDSVVEVGDYSASNKVSSRANGGFFDYIDEEDNQYFLLFGGLSFTSQTTVDIANDLWEFELNSEMWKKYEESQISNMKALYPVSFHQTDVRKLYIFGKNSEDNTMELWENMKFRIDCAGHAEKNENTGECYCIDDYYGDSCENFDCFGVNFLNNSSCSGEGTCLSPDTCSCNQGYVGDECDDWLCYDEKASEKDTSCSGSGECVGVDQCRCHTVDDENAGFFGIKCQEKIGNYGERTEGTTTLKIVYVMQSSLIPSVTACSSFFLNHSKFGEYSTCNFELGDDGQTTYMTVSMNDNNSIEDGNTLILVPITSDENEIDYVYVTVNDIPKEVNITLIIVIVTLSVVTIFAIILICLGLCLMPKILKAFKVQKKFNGLEDIDLIYEEQKLMKTEGLAHLQINKELFTINPDEISLIRELGSGGSQTIVYLVEWLSQKAAFKSFRVTNPLCNTQESFSEFEREINIMVNLNHPHIIQFLGALIKPPRLGYLIEYCKLGSIRHFLLNYKYDTMKSYPPNEKIRMLLEICRGMSYLHSKEIIHRDLKPENVLVDDSQKCKICDFGLSRIIEADVTMTSRVGTSMFIAPEIWQGKRYDGKADSFSFAFTAHCVMTDEYNPLGQGSGVELKISRDPEFRPNFDNPIWKDHLFLKQIISNMWGNDPKKRDGFETAIQKLNIGMDLTKGTENNVKIESSGANEWRKTVDNLLEMVKKLTSENDELKKKIKGEKIPLLKKVKDEEEPKTEKEKFESSVDRSELDDEEDEAMTPNTESLNRISFNQKKTIEM